MKVTNIRSLIDNYGFKVLSYDGMLMPHTGLGKPVTLHVHIDAIGQGFKKDVEAFHWQAMRSYVSEVDLPVFERVIVEGIVYWSHKHHVIAEKWGNLEYI